MMTAKWLEEQLSRDRGTLEFKIEYAIINFTEQISALMKDAKVNKADLAKRLNTSKAFVTKVLRGNNNFTLKTMISIANVLGATLTVQVNPEHKDISLNYIKKGLGEPIVLGADTPPDYSYQGEKDNDYTCQAA